MPDLERQRLEILEATLRHVPFDGWTERALEAGAEEAGVDAPTRARAFPGGMKEVFRAHMDESDRKMVAALEAADLEAMRIRDRVAFAVRTRLEQNARHREAARRAAAFLMLPANAGEAARATWRTVDAIWYAIGDRSADFNFYSKRGLLAAVYVSTFFVWLNDDSDGFADSWAFLDRRIGDVMKVPKLKGQAAEALACLAGPLRRFLNPTP
ncbi:MAG: COQ9 family protein [Alphaproteobacteria bacterium]|nr:COQ9 family protein [Alphaproteobacteria bacterium]